MSHDPTIANNKTANKVISRFHKEGLISKNIAEDLKNENPHTTHFYLKPKLHQVGFLERPVIRSKNCHTTKMSEYANYHLQPIFKACAPYFSTNFYLSSHDSPSKTMKDVFYFI